MTATDLRGRKSRNDDPQQTSLLDLDPYEGWPDDAFDVGGKPFFLWEVFGKGYEVYRWWDAEGTLLYVGISNDVRKRFKEHKRQSVWVPWAKHGEAYRFANERDAREAESYLIRLARPVFNIAGADDGWRMRRFRYFVHVGELELASYYADPTFRLGAE